MFLLETILPDAISTQLKDVTLLSTFIRLILAVFFGGMIGIERGRRRRTAGMRTHILVCVGAALVMITNQYVFAEYGVSDPTRLGAQVISGIGFLGVGTIIIDRQRQVRGLTTAAGLWTCACMGLALGIGFYTGAFFGFAFIMVTIAIINKLEHQIIIKSRRMEIYAEFESYNDINSFVTNVACYRIKIMHIEVVPPRGYSGKKDSRSAAIITLVLPKKYPHADVLHQMGVAPGLIALEEV